MRMCWDTGIIAPSDSSRDCCTRSGVLDQNFWSDGIYLAPGDDAMAYDLLSIKQFGHNYVRLHQKVNPDRWYYHADRLGIAVAQDVVQHYGDSIQGIGTEMQSNNGNERSF